MSEDFIPDAAVPYLIGIAGAVLIVIAICATITDNDCLSRCSSDNVACIKECKK